MTKSVQGCLAPDCCACQKSSYAQQQMALEYTLQAC